MRAAEVALQAHILLSFKHIYHTICWALEDGGEVFQPLGDMEFMDSMGEAIQVEKIEADLVYRISWVPSTSIPIPSRIPTRPSTQCPTEQLCYMAAPSSEWMRKWACFENKVKLS